LHYTTGDLNQLIGTNRLRLVSYGSRPSYAYSDNFNTRDGLNRKVVVKGDILYTNRRGGALNFG